MKKDFAEELQNLKKIQKEIDVDIATYQKKVDSLKDEVLDRQTFDYEDAERWRYSKRQYDSAKENIAGFKELKKSPYFGRFDLEEIGDGEIVQHYIGKESFWHDGELEIIDWRTDIGNIYYRSDISGRKFNVNGHEYEMALKRSINIVDGQLKSCETNYDSFNAELDGEVVDSFLVEVLRDKRRDRKVTDIIRTIQEDQNRILRQPKESSFVLQGCAGSGKTMILLHRLSYILFNKMYKPEEILVITPNKYFDAQINDLSRELGLNDIKRMTVDEYYQELISLVGGRRFARKIENESLLDHSELEKAYSKDLADDIKNRYQDLINQLKETIEDEDIREIILKSGQSVPSMTSPIISGFVSAYDNASKEIDSVYTLVKRIGKLEEQIGKTDAKAKATVKPLLGELSKMFSEINAEIPLVNEEKDRLEKENEEDLSMISAYEEEAGGKAIDKSKVTSLDYILSRQDEVAEFMYEGCKVEIGRLQEAKAQLDKIPAYNFIRRNQQQRNVRAAEEKFIAVVELVFADYQKKNPIADFSEEIRELENAITKRKERIAAIEKDVAGKNRKLLVISSTLEKLEEMGKTRDILEFCENSGIEIVRLKTSELREIAKELKDPEEKISASNTQLRTITSKNKEISKLETYEYEIIRNFRNFLKRYEYENLEKSVLSEAIELPILSEDGQAAYRYQLYLKLLISSMYYSLPRFSRKLICFDEAQDLSPREYDLFAKLNRNDCVYNLYGDINQALNEYETTFDWSEINSMREKEIFMLNQNYRNSYQITEYCNNFFGSEITPIGIKGEADVIEEATLEGAMKRIAEIKNQDSTKRCVVIYSGQNSKMAIALRYLANRLGMNFNELDDSKVSVLTVPMIKGT